MSNYPYPFVLIKDDIEGSLNQFGEPTPELYRVVMLIIGGTIREGSPHDQTESAMLVVATEVIFQQLFNGFDPLDFEGIPRPTLFDELEEIQQKDPKVISATIGKTREASWPFWALEDERHTLHGANNRVAADTKVRICALEERTQAQALRAALLESRVGRADPVLAERLQRNEEALAELRDCVYRLLGESAGRHRAEAAEAVEGAEAEPAVCGHRDSGPEALPRVSLEGAVAEMKRELRGAGILSARFSDLGADRFAGIISRVNGECGGNPGDRGAIVITASSVSRSRAPRNAADLTDPTKIFSSKDGANQWIEWDFKSADIKPTHYSIRTHGGPSGGGHLWQSVLEGRTGDEGWTVLGERRDDSQLNSMSFTATFEIAARLRVQILRLRQTGLNHRGTIASLFKLLRFSGFCTADLGKRECLNQINPSVTSFVGMAL
jgi:hypothetical protein